MAQRLEQLQVDEVSLVDRPANSEVVDGKKIPRATVALFKRDLSAALWDSEDAVCKAVDGPDEGVAKDGKTYGGTSYPKSDFAYAPTDSPSDWKLRLTNSPGGSPDAGIVGAAVAALGKGFRGKKVQIPAEALPSVKAKVRAAWKKANPDKGADEMPEVLKGEIMTLQEIEKKLSDQETALASTTSEINILKSENVLLKTENDLVCKMSKKERKLYASMPTEKRKDYVAADAEKRKTMMGAAEGEKKEKAAEDCMDEATKKRFREAGPIQKAAMLAEFEKAAKAKGAKGGDSEDEGEPDEDDLEKRAMVEEIASTKDRVAKTEAELASVRKAARKADFVKRAEADLSHTPGTAVEKADKLMVMAEALPTDVFEKAFGDMKEADKAFKKNFEEVGKSGADVPALAQFDAAVEQICKSEKIDKAHATERVMMTQPDLYMAYEKDQRAMASRF